MNPKKMSPTCPSAGHTPAMSILQCAPSAKLRQMLLQKRNSVCRRAGQNPAMLLEGTRAGPSHRARLPGRRALRVPRHREGVTPEEPRVQEVLHAVEAGVGEVFVGGGCLFLCLCVRVCVCVCFSSHREHHNLLPIAAVVVFVWYVTS